MNLLRASPREAAAQNSFVPWLLAALVGTGTFCLALAAGGQGTGQTAAVERNGLFQSNECNHQAAVKLQVSFVLLL